MTDQKHSAPRRYFVDAQGHRVLIGLSPEETAEFEALDPASNEIVQFTSEVRAGPRAAADGEVRWHELYSKHERSLAGVDRTKSGRTGAGFRIC
jgi:hypothetical protein